MIAYIMIPGKIDNLTLLDSDFAAVAEGRIAVVLAETLVSCPVPLYETFTDLLVYAMSAAGKLEPSLRSNDKVATPEGESALFIITVVSIVR
jgi:hypothetical protein